MIVLFVLSAEPKPPETVSFEASLPERLGGFEKVHGATMPALPMDRDLLKEYGLLRESRALYTNRTGVKMAAEVLQFGTSEGGYAAYLALQPDRCTNSPLGQFSDVRGAFGRTYAVLGGGVTVLSRNNYVFRFKGAAPTQSEMERILERLSSFDANSPIEGDCCRYFVESSERRIFGPVSLARFAAGVPASVVGFDSGVIGRISRFEFPGGPMRRVVLQYHSPAVAASRFERMRLLPGARLKLAGSQVGVVLDAVSAGEADALLNDIEQETGETVTFDLRYMLGGPMTLEDWAAPMILALILGSFAGVVRSRRWSKSVHNQTSELRLT